MAYRDLRDFIERLEQAGELVRITGEVDTRHEIAAYIRKISDTDGPALLFERVRGHDMPVVGGLFANRRRMLMALETDEAHAVEHYLAALDALQAPVPVGEGPCQEVILEGGDVDLTRLPAPVYCERDSGHYITAGVCISKDPEDGTRNASIYRLQVQGPRQLGVLSPAPHHLGIHYQKAEARGEALEVAVALGVAPAVLVATQWEAGYGVDELELVAPLQGAPLEVVRGRSVDLLVPAHAELVIEGRMLPGARESEGPFGEYTGYYTPAYPKPVMEVTALTHRRDPIFQAMLTGLPTTENHVLKMIPAESSCYRLLKQRFPGVRAVHLHGAGGAGLLAVVSMRQHAKHEARNVLATMLGAQGTKVVIVVDEDVDVFDLDKVMWAVCTRSQADRDVMVMPRMTGWQLDPSAPELGVYAGMGIDATVPFGETFDEVAEVPGVDALPEIPLPRGPARS